MKREKLWKREKRSRVKVIDGNSLPTGREKRSSPKPGIYQRT
jgi:hypothetical protein